MSRIEISLPPQDITAPWTSGLAALTSVIRTLSRHGRAADLSRLDARQLHDAGIDPAHAGRGRGVAVSAAAMRRLNSLSIG